MEKCLMLIFLVTATVVAATPRRSYPHGRIIGGSNAPDGAYPYQVSLRLFDGTYHLCGGSIVDKEWVVTAASCVSGIEPSQLKVYVGSTKLSEGGTQYNVVEVHKHEDYEWLTVKNNVAILKVDPITFTDKVGPIALDSELVEHGEPCTVIGWGTTDHWGSKPNDLQQLFTIAIISNYCEDQELCTLNLPGKGTCFGDLGGPVVRKVDGVYKQIGVVSLTEPCALDLPDKHSKVSYFLDWFQDKCNCV